MKQRFCNRSVLIRCALAAAASILYGILSGPFVLHLIDGLSIASILFLFLGVLNYWWKEGFFAFFSWKKKEEPSFLTYRERLREERKHADNHSLYAGLWLLAVSLLLTGLYLILV